MKLSVKQVFLHILLPIACFLFPIFFFFSQENYSHASSEELAEKLLRFHVIANSDSQEDQAVKLKVKENILSFLSPSLSYADDKEEAKQIISSQMDEILSIAQTTLAENGFSYSAQAFLTYCEFPVKSYGDLVFPAGTYETFQVILGDGNGKNWWCVMYPPLCFVDASFGTVPEESKNQLSTLLTEDTYESIQSSASENDSIPFRFGIFTFFNDLFHLS